MIHINIRSITKILNMGLLGQFNTFELYHESTKDRSLGNFFILVRPGKFMEILMLNIKILFCKFNGNLNIRQKTRVVSII